MPENTVYVGRPSKWGNPFTVAERDTCPTCGQETNDGYTAESAVASYRYFIDHPKNLHGWTMPTRKQIQQELRGKNIACWCPLDQPCHADVLLEVANE